ncbi:oligosaccharide flippase family protein [Patescibacteria group bacterium]
MIEKKWFKNSIFRGGAIFFIGGITTSALHYIYRIVMGRMLGPEVFGELIALISLILILAVPSAPVQTAAARFSAVYQAKDSLEQLKMLFRYLTKIFVFISLFLIILTVIFASLIQNFLKLSSINYVYFLAGIVMVMLVAGISKGILQGLKRFSQLSLSVVIESVGRVMLAVILVAFGFKMAGALVGFLISLVLGFLLTIYFLWDVLSKKQQTESNIQHTIYDKKETKKIWKYVFWSFLVFLFLNILLNVDIILVKHYFSSFEAGIYSGFATLGRMVFISIGLLAGIMFPVVVSKQARKEDYYHSLKITSLISFLIAGIISLVFFLFPKEFILIFFGEKYLAGASFLGYYSVVMAAFGFIFLLSYFFMALNKFKFLFILVFGGILEILLIGIWHADFLQVILMFFTAQIITLIGLGTLMILEKKKILI